MTLTASRVQGLLTTAVVVRFVRGRRGMKRRVVAPDGREWVVQLVWWPRLTAGSTLFDDATVGQGSVSRGQVRGSSAASRRWSASCSTRSSSFFGRLFLHSASSSAVAG